MDELTYSGAAINDLEVQLTRTKQLYHQVLIEGKTRVDVLRKRLHSHILKSEPFVEIWRRARQVRVHKMLCVVCDMLLTCCNICMLLGIPSAKFCYISCFVIHTPHAQVQERSNKAAARYDKANSQHLAAKEMIRVAESQLADCKAERKDLEEEPSSPSPLDLAWQEMLNHATSKVRSKYKRLYSAVITLLWLALLQWSSA